MSRYIRNFGQVKLIMNTLSPVSLNNQFIEYKILFCAFFDPTIENSILRIRLISKFYAYSYVSADIVRYVNIIMSNFNEQRISPFWDKYKYLVNCVKLRDLDLTDISKYNRIPRISISNTPVQDLSPIKNAKVLSLSHMHDIKDVSLLENETLILLYMLGIESLKISDKIRDLRIFDLRNLPKLDPMENLEYLSISLSNISDISPLRHSTKLKKIELMNMIHVTDISPISHVYDVTLKRLFGLEDYSPLINVKILHLDNVYMTKEDLIHFRNASELTISSPIGHIIFVCDYDEIGNFPNLKKLYLNDVILFTVGKFRNIPEIHLSNLNHVIIDLHTLRDVPILHIQDLHKVTDLNVLSNVGELHITSSHRIHVNHNIDNLKTVQDLYLHRLYTDSDLSTFTNIRHMGDVYNIRRSTRLKRRRVSNPVLGHVREHPGADTN